jgi:hypothetical protein
VLSSPRIRTEKDFMAPSPTLPTLTPNARSRARADDSVVFAVYAPFGSDPTLSRFPADTQAAIAKQALVRALQAVAAEGANVSALIDLFEDDSWLVEIPAGQPKAMTITSAWKQDMSAPQALAGFLRRTQQRFPCSTLVLAIEGHGGGFVPDIDPLHITPRSTTTWGSPAAPNHVRWVQTESQTRVEPDAGSPALPMDSPMLPMDSPMLPASRLPLSTWAVGEALRSAIKSGVPRPAVIHFNNCFNASFELLHTVAPFADVATAYANYDFFTAGAAYPAVFKRLRLAGSATRLQLGQWFAAENGALLKAKKNHPTVGATVALAAVRTKMAAALDALASALLKALQTAANRPDVVARIKLAATQAQHFDTDADNRLQVPDQFIDLGSFAVRLQATFAGAPGASALVPAAAAALQATLAGTWQYGDWDRPWMDETQVWDFRNTTLGLNIFFPDPDLRGVWDWRSPYYLSGTVDPKKPPAQRHVIDFLKDAGSAPSVTRPRWVAFIVEYHQGVPLVGFLPALAPVFPLFNARFQAKLPHPGGDNPSSTSPKTAG